MQSLRIETEGLSLKEVFELEAVLREIEGVEEAKFTPFLPGTMEYRSFGVPQMAIKTGYILFKLAGGSIGAAALKKMGDEVVDKVWDAIKGKLTGESVVPVSIKLYGPNGEVIKEIKGKR